MPDTSARAHPSSQSQARCLKCARNFWTARERRFLSTEAETESDSARTERGLPSK